MGVLQGSVIGPLLFNIVINDIIKSSSRIVFILCADDTTLNSTLETFGTKQVDLEKSITIELQNILKCLDVNKLYLNVVDSLLLYFFKIISFIIDFDYKLIDYSILCLHIICVYIVTHIKLYSQIVFLVLGHMPRKSLAR